MKKTYTTKSQKIEEAYRKFLTDSAYETIKSKINFQGYIHENHLFESIGSWVKEHMVQSNDFWRPITLIGLESNNGWTINEDKFDYNADETFYCWFETNSSDEVYIGKYSHGYFTAEDLSFQSKDVVAFHLLIQPPKYFFNKK